MQRPASTSAHSAISSRPAPSSAQQVNTQTKILDTIHGRILCVADIRGRLSALNDLAREANAHAVIHTGDFGFFGEHMDHIFALFCLMNMRQNLQVLTGSMTALCVTSQCIPL
jgi:hypothetical protein